MHNSPESGAVGTFKDLVRKTEHIALRRASWRDELELEEKEITAVEGPEPQPRASVCAGLFERPQRRTAGQMASVTQMCFLGVLESWVQGLILRPLFSAGKGPLWFEDKMSPIGQCVWILGLQSVWLLWKVVEPLWRGAWKRKWVTVSRLKFLSQASLSSYLCSASWLWSQCDQYLVLLTPHSPQHAGLYGTVRQNKPSLADWVNACCQAWCWDNMVEGWIEQALEAASELYTHSTACSCVDTHTHSHSLTWIAHCQAFGYTNESNTRPTHPSFPFLYECT